mgnify:FL=1
MNDLVHADSGAGEKTEKSPDLHAFATEMADTLFSLEGCDLDNFELQAILENHGIISFRTPKPSEIADEEWWGHEFYRAEAPDVKFVGELSAAFKALRKSVDRSDEPKSEGSK